MYVIRAGIHKMRFRIANREDPDHTASSLIMKQSDLSLHCHKLVIKSLEHLLLTLKCKRYGMNSLNVND